MTATPDSIRANVESVQARIADAARRSGRDPDAVTLVAAAKTVPADVLQHVLGCGVVDLGENRAQELLEKAPELNAGAVRPRWHFIGALQRNKVKALSPWVERWHSVDREPLGAAIARHQPGAKVFVEVNLGEEPAKAGCTPGEVGALVGGLRQHGLSVDGLMTVPPDDADPRRWFATLAELAAQTGLRELSMGMTHDFEVAIEEGATFVRVGRAIFGSRPT